MSTQYWHHPHSCIMDISFDDNIIVWLAQFYYVLFHSSLSSLDTSLFRCFMKLHLPMAHLTTPLQTNIWSVTHALHCQQSNSCSFTLHFPTASIYNGFVIYSFMYVNLLLSSSSDIKRKLKIKSMVRNQRRQAELSIFANCEIVYNGNFHLSQHWQSERPLTCSFSSFHWLIRCLYFLAQLWSHGNTVTHFTLTY